MTLSYNTLTEVSEVKYRKVIVEYSGFIAHRQENGKFYIMWWYRSGRLKSHLKNIYPMTRITKIKKFLLWLPVIGLLYIFKLKNKHLPEPFLYGIYQGVCICGLFFIILNFSYSS